MSTYEIKTENIENNNQSNIKEIYVLNLKKDIKAKVEDKGYIVNSVFVEIEDNEEYRIKSIEIVVNKKQNKEASSENKIVNTIESINIQVEISNTNVEEKSNETSLTKSETEEIQKYISDTYDVKTKKIKIN